MQKAAAWIKTLPAGSNADAIATGAFIFRGVAIRADLLLLLIRENCVAKLHMHRAQISSSGLVSVLHAAMYSDVITALSLGWIDIDEIALNALAMLMKTSKSIVEYYLWELDIRDDGVALICDALAENNVIEVLNLSQNDFGVEGARSLARFLKANKNTRLAHLVLLGNSIGDEGVVALADGLRSNDSLRALNLGYCGISDEGAIALASLLSHGSHLETLDLRENQIGEAGMKALANALKRNQSLQVFLAQSNAGLEGAGIEDAFIKALQNNVTLHTLEGIKSSTIKSLLLRNKMQIPEAVRRAALLLIGIRRSTDFEGMGDFAVFPKDIVRLIAQTVWATRKDPIWIQALK
jgi:hypothetical protein